MARLPWKVKSLTSLEHNDNNLLSLGGGGGLRDVPSRVVGKRNELSHVFLFN